MPILDRHTRSRLALLRSPKTPYRNAVRRGSFEIISYEETGQDSHQDLILCRKR
jgi:hypothetical protein